MSTEQINSLYRVILLGMDNVESRARRGRSWRKMLVALRVTHLLARVYSFLQICAGKLKVYYICDH